MKTIEIIKYFEILAILFTSQVCISQTYKENTKANNVPTAQEIEDNEKQITPEVLTTFGIGTISNPRNAVIQGNQVFIRQIGDFNEAEINTRTNASEINLEQLGNSNFAKLDYTVNTAISDILQNGNNNQMRDFVNQVGADISLDLIQNGDNLNFERNGVNELTKSIQFRQTESTPNLIIRSFF